MSRSRRIVPLQRPLPWPSLPARHGQLARPFTRLAAALATLALTGCATLSNHPTQTVRLRVLDAHERPIEGLQCRIAPDGDTVLPVRAATVVLGAGGATVDIRRSGASLVIDCRRGNDIARATVHPRRDGLEQALVPFGSLAVLVDHMTGSLYAYPTDLQLRLGQHVTLAHGEQSRIVSAQPIAGAATARAAPQPATTAARTETAATRNGGAGAAALASGTQATRFGPAANRTLAALPARSVLADHPTSVW